MTLELGVLGVGHMAGTILEGAFRHGVLLPSRVMVADRDASRLEHFGKMGCVVAGETSRLQEVSNLLCAVRPQDFAAAAEDVGHLSAQHLVISVMAGVASDSIQEQFGGSCRVVRTMSNTGAALGCSMTAVAPGHGSIDQDLDFVNGLFDAIGRTVDIPEDLMSAATAVSGSGPGWVYLLASSMIDAAVEVGFEPAVADLMVRQTLLAAGRSLGDDGACVSSLLDGIASKGGTTEAGLATMQEHGFRAAVLAGVVAARDRGDALGSSGDQ